MKTDELRTRTREVRRQLVREGPSWTRHRERDFETVTMPERDCDLLRDLLISEGAETVVEVGLAYASSALAIGEALVTVDPPHPRHVVIDPFQERAWSNVGVGPAALCRTGLDRQAHARPVIDRTSTTCHRRPRRRRGLCGRQPPVPRGLR